MTLMAPGKATWRGRYARGLRLKCRAQTAALCALAVEGAIAGRQSQPVNTLCSDEAGVPSSGCNFSPMRRSMIAIIP